MRLTLKTAIVLLSTLISVSLSAQPLKAGKLTLTENREDTDKWPKDNNGKLSSQIIVVSCINGLEFKSDLIMGDVDNVGNEYRFFVFPQKKNKKNIIVRHDTYTLTEMAIWSDDDKPLQSGKTYKANVETGAFTGIELTIEPRIATVMIDNVSYDLQKTNTITLMPNTLHELVVSLDGYLTHKHIFKLMDGERRGHSVTLMPAHEGTKRVRIKAPQNAVVMIDKETLHYPYEKELSRGNHVLECMTNGMRIKNEMHIDNDTTIDLVNPKVVQTIIAAPAVAMAQKASDKTNSLLGQLIISSTPAGAHIKIDDRYVGDTPQIIEDLSQGTHKVEVQKAGYGIYSTVAQVEGGKMTALNVVLESGKQISISTGRIGEFVFVDGHLVGSSPVSVFLSNGKHTAYAVRSNSQSYGPNDETSRVETIWVGDNVYNTRYQLAYEPSVHTVNGVSFEMIHVNGGTFTMGSDDWMTDSIERPAHSVALSNYYIGKTEVTQALWQAVMGKNPSKLKGDNLPVECVTWHDCQEFVSKLSVMTGLNFTLPTEAQWEFAARGGNMSENYQYSGSNDTSVAWCAASQCTGTHEVATKKPNELGIHDMSGNVWEWCSDWKGKYNGEAQLDPTGPIKGANKIYRGGSWQSDNRKCRVTGRGYGGPMGKGYGLGLRLVRNAD